MVRAEHVRRRDPGARAGRHFSTAEGRTAQPGPAFAARALAGGPWGRSEQELDSLVNPQDLTRLVVFDTWTLNGDRHHHDLTVRRPNYDNVYLASEGVEPGKRRLIAMDHGLCFIRSGEDLTKKLAQIDKVRDEHVDGLFPEFRSRLQDDIIVKCAARLKEMDIETARAMIETVPTQWEVSKEAREAWAELIYRRADIVADKIQEWIQSVPP